MRSTESSMDVSWQRAFDRLVLATGILSVIHIADDFLRDDLPVGATLFGLGSIGLLTIYLFGWLWARRGRKLGYWIVLIGAVFVFWGDFLSHALGANVDTISEIATTTGGWGLVVATTSLLAGVTSLATAILAIYLLARPEARA